MLKFKQFLDSLEEKYLLGLGRKTWQFLAIPAVLMVLLGAIWYLINSRPSSRVRVKLDKWEVYENKIDTTGRVVKEKACSSEIMKSSLDSLRKLVFFLEWDSLGRFEEKSYYITDKNGNYVYDRNSRDYVKAKKRVFITNERAVPNMLNAIYQQRYLDSMDLCGRIEVISAVWLLSSLYESKFLSTGTKFKDLCSQLEYHRNLNKEAVNTAKAINTIVDKDFRLISDNETLRRFYEILLHTLGSSFSNENIVLLDSIVSAHRALDPGKSGDPDDYFEVLKILQAANIEDPGHLSRAIEGFNADMSFYRELGLVKSLRHYLRLYREKLEWVENRKMNQQLSKAANRKKALNVILISLLSIGIMTIILLLFSIQRQMRQSKSLEEGGHR